MCPGEPYLLDALIRVRAFVPQQGMEGVACIVERERMARTLDGVAQFTVGEFKAVDQQVDGVANMEGQADSIHRIPDADKRDRHVVLETTGGLELPNL